MRTITAIGLAVLVVGTVGCASRPSVSEYQCLAGDWQTIGFRDGASGLQSTRILAHQEACGAFNIIPDRQVYLSGWHEGVATYCEPSNGFALGARGAGHNNVCTGGLYTPFTSAYADGKTLYVARAEVNRLHDLLSRQEARLYEIKREMTNVATAQLNPTLTVEERVSLVAELGALADERSAIQTELPRLEQALVEKEQELASLTQNLAGPAY